jgi:histidinol-phosphate/aromatic aminotransferase/cobyric acid decarboxylase-like protein
MRCPAYVLPTWWQNRTSPQSCACWLRTHDLRGQLAADLAGLDDSLIVEEGVANFLNLTLAPSGPSAAQLVRECRVHDVYLRDLSPLSSQYQGKTVRIAVKDTGDNARIVAACRDALDRLRRRASPMASLPDAEAVAVPRR